MGEGVSETEHFEIAEAPTRKRAVPEMGERRLGVSHLTSHNPLLALRPPGPKRRRLVRRRLESKPANFLLVSIFRSQSRRVRRSPGHSRRSRRSRLLLLLQVDHGRAIIQIRGNEIRVLPQLGISVGIDDGNRRFSGDDSKLTTEVLHRSMERGFASQSETPVLPVAVNKRFHMSPAMLCEVREESEAHLPCPIPIVNSRCLW